MEQEQVNAQGVTSPIKDYLFILSTHLVTTDLWHNRWNCDIDAKLRKIHQIEQKAQRSQIKIINHQRNLTFEIQEENNLTENCRKEKCQTTASTCDNFEKNKC